MPVQFEIVLKDDPSNASKAPAGGGGGAGASPQDDIVEAARRRIYSQERNREINQMVTKFRELTGTGPSPFDPVGEARKRLEAQDRSAAVKAEMGKLRPESGGGVGEALGTAKNALGQIAGSGALGSGIATIAPILTAAAPIALFVGAVAAFKSGVSMIVNHGEKLQAFSGEISIARAQANVATIMRNMREAEALGPMIARLTTAQSNFADSWSKFWTPIENKIGNVLADAMESINGKGGDSALDKILDVFEKMPEALEKLSPDQRAEIERLRAKRNEEREAAVDKLWNFLDDDVAPGGFQGRRDAQEDLGRQRLGMPAITEF